MLRPQGYATIVDPSAPLTEFDTITCSHCQHVVRVKPGTAVTIYLVQQPAGNWKEEPGAFCLQCMRAICLKCHAAGRCTPFEKRIEIMERRSRFFKSIGVVGLLLMLGTGLRAQFISGDVLTGTNPGASGVDTTFCPTPSLTTTTLGDWPTVAANPQRMAYSPVNTASVTGVAWYRPIEAYIPSNTQMIAVGGSVFAATTRGLIVLNGETGALQWRFDTEMPVGTPTVSGGVVYLPGWDRRLYALNATTGDLMWAFEGADGGFSGNPLVSNGRVFVGNRNGTFYAINATNGNQVWSYPTNGPIMQSAACDAGIIYVASMDMYGYALNASTGALVWKTPAKLPGELYSTWWPVVYGNYVVWSSATPYKKDVTPGLLSIPKPSWGIEDVAFFAEDIVSRGPYAAATVYAANDAVQCTTPLCGAAGGYVSLVAGNVGNSPPTSPTQWRSTTNWRSGQYIASDDGSHGWPAASSVLNTVAKSDSAQPWTLQSYADAYPSRRLYALVNKSNGVEAQNLPWIIAGQNNEGQMHPPMTDGTSLFVNTVWTSALSFANAGTIGGISRSAVLAWQPTTTWLRKVSAVDYAFDEPLIVFGAGGRTYTQLCCDRIAQRVDASGQTFWDYSQMLDGKLPNGTAANAYDINWQFVHEANAPHSFERLSGYYQGASTSRNGVYNSHGNQNPLTPHAFVNASSQTIVRMFTHRSGAIIGLGPTASLTPQPLVTINTAPTYQGRRISAGVLQTYLEREIGLMVDLFLSNGTNGFLKPAYLSDGGDAINGNPEGSYNFRRPADTVTTLALAYPFLTGTLRTNTATYLAAYWTKYFSTGTPVRNIGFSTGAAREVMVLPSDVSGAMLATADSTAGVSPQRVFYAAWKYAANVTPGTAAAIYATVRPLLVYPPSVTSATYERLPQTINDYLEGYYGFMRLYDAAGISTEAALRANVETSYNTILATRLSTFSIEHPWGNGTGPSYDNPTGVSGNIYARRFNCSRQFTYLTPELGSEYAVSTGASTMLASLTNSEYMCPQWFEAHSFDTWQEGAAHHMYDAHAVFLARAYLKGESQGELSKWLDVPWMIGDLYYIQNLIAALSASTPSITSLTGAATVAQYAKYEIDLGVTGISATNTQMPYDAAPPAGIPANYGVTVNVQFSPDNFVTTYSAPAFLYKDFTYTTLSGGRESATPAVGTSWKARIAFPTTGAWKYRMTAQDAGGSDVSVTRNVTVTAGSDPGYVRASTVDTRYFERQNGSLFQPLGYNDGDQWTAPLVDATARYANVGGNGGNWLRRWLAPASIYGSAWNPWYGLRGDYGGYIPRTGLNIDTTKALTEDGAVTLRLSYGPGNNHFYDAGRFIGGFRNPIAIEASTLYRFTVSYETFNIVGPRNSGCPNYGLVLKIQNPLSGTWHTTGATAAYECGSANSTGQVLSAYAGNTSSVSTLTGTWTSGSSGASSQLLPPFYLALENVCAVSSTCSVPNPASVPQAYIRSVTMYKISEGLAVGPDLMDKGNFAQHLYFDQKFSYLMDRIVGQAEANDVYLQLVALERNEDISLQITDAGAFGASSANNFYTVPSTAGRWLQDAWFRYLQARWGYSTHVFAWELMNEGDPANTRHQNQSSSFATTMHAYLANRHMATTSVWFGAPSWYTAARSEDFFSLHAYPVSTTQTAEVNRDATVDSTAVVGCVAGDNACWRVRMTMDEALLHLEHSGQYAATRTFGKPFFRDETGIDITGQTEHTGLVSDTRGVWFHNLLWSQLDAGALSEGYFWPTNMTLRPGPDGSTANGLHEILQPFSAFLSDIPLNNGHYVTIGASVSAPTVVRVVGQKDLTNFRAHAWIQNRKHLWCGQVGGVTDCPSIWDDSALSGTVTITGFQVATSYPIAWHYFDENGLETTSTTTILSDGSGNLVLNLSALPITAADAAVKIGAY